MIDLVDWPNDRSRKARPGELRVVAAYYHRGLMAVQGRYPNGDYFVTVYHDDGTRAHEHSCHSTPSEQRALDIYDGYCRSVLEAA